MLTEFGIGGFFKIFRKLFLEFWILWNRQLMASHSWEIEAILRLLFIIGENPAADRVWYKILPFVYLPVLFNKRLKTDLSQATSYSAQIILSTWALKITITLFLCEQLACKSRLHEISKIGGLTLPTNFSYPSIDIEEKRFSMPLCIHSLKYLER